jgi:AcrR family transcriptional regulator
MTDAMEAARPAQSRHAAPARRRGRPAANSVAPVGEERLLSLAFVHFAEKGYEATTVRELARRLGVSHNLLNVRFGRKQDLWKAAVDWRLAAASRDVVPAFDGQGNAQERLVDVVERFCQWATINADIVSISFQEGQRRSWRLDYIVGHFIRPFQAQLDLLIEEARATHPVASLSSGALMSLLVHGVGSYFALRPLHDQLMEKSDDGELSADARALARFITAGLFHQP